MRSTILNEIMKESNYLEIMKYNYLKNNDRKY